MAVDMQLIKSINDLDFEILSQKGRNKTLRDGYIGAIKNTPEYEALTDAKSEFKKARLKLERRIAADSAIQSIASELDSGRLTLKDLKEILSHHLVEYFKVSGRKAVKVDDPEFEPVMREIMLTARLGKESTEEPETMPLFDVPTGSGRSYEISSSLSDSKLVIDAEGMHSEPKWPAMNRFRKKQLS